MKRTQRERIIDYINTFGSISTREAFIDIGVARLGARISEMRKDGMKIIGKTEHSKNRYGQACHYMRYYIEEKTL